jgi:recombination endonuclease VII
METDVVIAMLADQDGRCEVCSAVMTMGRGPESAHLDHNKASGKVRGFLCGSCNWNVGFYETVQGFSEEYRIAIEAYLNRYL